MYINTNKALILSILLFIQATCPKITTVIFDLDGVLFTTNKLILTWQIGPARLINYWARRNDPGKASHRFYCFLQTIKPQSHNNVTANDPQGHKLPPLMTDWLTGYLNSWEILRLVDNEIAKNPTAFSRTELYLFKGIANAIFNPEIYITTKRPMRASVDLVKKCKRQGYKIIILSNWDTVTFTALKKVYPDFFDLFDDIVISAHTGMVKPDKKIFQLVLDKHNLQPKHCLFIDDQLCNVTSSNECGIHGIQFKNGAIPHIKKLLS